VLNVVLWKWRNSGNWKHYDAGHVNRLARMLAAHLRVPHRVVCFTDDAGGIDESVKCLPLDSAAAPIPRFERMPLRNCFRKLGLFNPAMRDIAGERLLQIDLDTVIVGDITHLAERVEPMVIWRSPSVGKKGFALNTSLVLLTAGSRADIWDTYCSDPEGVARAAQLAGWTGTDQAVVAHLAPEAATFEESDGVISFRDHLKGGMRGLPPDARMVSFYDRFDPADPKVRAIAPWIAEAEAA
jgi:hypothetical protein